MTQFHTVKIKKYSDVIEEFVANAEIYPGMLIELMSTGKVRKHNNDGGNALAMFALEDEMQGGSILTAYEAGTQVQCWIPYRGDIVYAQLKDGQNVAIGDPLMSDGLGHLMKYSHTHNSEYTMNPLQIVGFAAEAMNLSSSSGGDTAAPGIAGNRFMKVRVA